MTAGWAEKQHLGDLPTFANAEGSDVAQFESFDEESQRLIDHGETAKVRPQETSRWFAETAEYVLTKVDEAEKRHTTDSGLDRLRSRREQQRHDKEFNSTIVDLRILANLARVPFAADSGRRQLSLIRADEGSRCPGRRNRVRTRRH